MREALRREGELLRDLAHPHLVRAYGVHGEPRDAVVLETLAGRTVQHALASARRLPTAAQVAVLGGQLGGALRFLHRHGVLHLDVKPGNVVLGDDGLARLIDLSHAGPPGRYEPGRGTWSARSPEQCRGGELTAAADVWGLGLLLRELASGVNPLEELADCHDTDDPALAAPVPPVRPAARGCTAGWPASWTRCWRPRPPTGRAWTRSWPGWPRWRGERERYRTRIVRTIASWPAIAMRTL
jgi:serine/threonine protein kinase